MILGPLRIAPDLPVQHGLHPRQPQRRLLPARELQRRQHEQMRRHERGRRVAGQAEDEFFGRSAGVVLEGHGGEGAWLAGLHGHAAEADGAAEGALDGRLEEVELAHRDPARGHDDVDVAEGAPKVLFEGAGSVGERVVGFGCFWRGGSDLLVFGDTEIGYLETPARYGGHEGRAIAVSHLAELQGPLAVVQDDFVPGAEHAD